MVLEEAFLKLSISENERLEGLRRLERSIRLVEKCAGGYFGKDVLELGAGSGVHACAAKRLGATKVIALDKYVYPTSDENHFRFPDNAFERLRSTWSTYGVEAHEADLDHLWDFNDASFDLVISNAVFEHLHGTHKHFFSEASRVLKPGGILFISTPNLGYLPKRMRFLIGKSPCWDLLDFFNSGSAFTGHTREFMAQELRLMAECSGLDVEYCRSHVTYFRWAWLRQFHKIHRLPIAILSMIGSNLGDHVFLTARKPRTALEK
jgi:SAM-dependent methyltransferase